MKNRAATGGYLLVTIPVLNEEETVGQVIRSVPPVPCPSQPVVVRARSGQPHRERRRDPPRKTM